MDMIFDGFLELLIFAVIVIAQIIAASFARKKKRQQQEQAQHKQERQHPVPPSTPKTAIKTKTAVAPPKAQRSKQSSAANNDWLKAMEERERRIAQKNAQNEEAAAYNQTAPTAVPSENENTLLAQARTGIIWSEILRPPVSVRSESF
ncbi:MAG: hypothetical protein LBU70_09570 [Chitinispirillales bacterium]|jgi:hypothetical protein|nr:hypothetical protein [Chitinispirillales bacterium]